MPSATLYHLFQLLSGHIKKRIIFLQLNFSSDDRNSFLKYVRLFEDYVLPIQFFTIFAANSISSLERSGWCLKKKWNCDKPIVNYTFYYYFVVFVHVHSEPQFRSFIN